MTTPRVAVLDYGSGNLHSATRALAAAGAEVTLTSQAAEVLASEGLVVPGVGAFAACMAGLHRIDGAAIIGAALDQGIPVLGICVGHQVLFDEGTEHGRTTAGLGLLPGRVERLASVRLPHMGWNTVSPAPGSALFAGIGDQRFYFVHSYAVTDSEGFGPDVATTWTEHQGVRFLAAAESGLLSSTQFHPEKSGAAGAALLNNWIAGIPLASR